MKYITIRARDQAGNLLYEKDADANIFSPVAIYITAALRMQGLMGQQEKFCLLVTPHSVGEPEHHQPLLTAVSNDDMDWNTLHGLHLTANHQPQPSDAPVRYFAFILFSGRLPTSC